MTFAEMNVRAQERLLVAVFSLGLGLTIGRLFARLLGKHKKDHVAASGRLIAAWRALESLEAQPLFIDPFGAALAGSEAVHQALQLACPFPPLDSSSTTAPPRPGRRFCYSNVATRVWWFDRQLLAALRRPLQQPARQVVVLGAGFDTRPWRLSLPSGVKWFEVDLAEVVAAKKEQLEQLGAALEAGHHAAVHPLRCASWTALSADLSKPGWAAALMAAGLDGTRPIVWVAEGLLMYLTDAQAETLLSEMAVVSPPGSSVILHNCGNELIELIRSGSTNYDPFPRELVATWRSGFPLASDRPALESLLNRVGWPQLEEATSRARIAADIVATRQSLGAAPYEAGNGSRSALGARQSSGASPDGQKPAGFAGPAVGVDEVARQVDFEARPDHGRDRWAVFVAAGK